MNEYTGIAPKKVAGYDITQTQNSEIIALENVEGSIQTELKIPGCLIIHLYLE